MIAVLTSLTFILVLWEVSWYLRDRYLGLTGPTPLPILGNLLQILKPARTGQVYLTLEALSKKHGDTFRVQLPQKMVVVSTNVDLLAQIVNNPNFGKAEEYRFYIPWLGESTIITSTGPRWRMLRKLVDHAYHYQILDHAMTVFNEQSRILVSNLEKLDGACVDVCPFIAAYALDVITQVTSGVKTEAQAKTLTESHQRYISASSEILRVIDERILNPLYYFDWIWRYSRRAKRESELIQTLHGYVDAIIANRYEKLKQMDENNNEPTRHKILLDLLLKAKDEGSSLTNDDIRGEVNTATFAGHSSTTITASFFLYCLAQNQSVQQKVFDEIETYLTNATVPNMSNIKTLKYLDAAFKESMRMFTLAPIVARQGSVPIEFESKIIPAGTTIYFLVNSIHMDPKYYSEPHLYNPDRFLGGDVNQRHPYSYIPFSTGLRSCAGQKLATFSIKMLTISILKKFHINLGYEDFKPQIYSEEFMKSANGIQLRFIPRLKLNKKME